MRAKPRIYLSYAREDQDKVLEIYEKLSLEGFEPWMDFKDILPGQKWANEILKTIRESDIILVFLSKSSVEKNGYLRKEIRLALEMSEEKMASDIFLIPVRLEECPIPLRLSYFQPVDLFKKYGWDFLIRSLHHTLTPSLPPLEPPKPLVQACAAGECVLYAGAGLSARAGLPTWNTFASGLLDWAVSNRFIDEKHSESLRMTLRQGDNDLVVDNIVSQMQAENRDKWLDYLKKVLLDPAPPLPESHRIMKKIGFNAVLTTNFDDLLEKTFISDDSAYNVFTHVDTEPLLDNLTKREFFILKLHGTLQRPETVLLAPSQYEDSIAGNLPFSEFMESLFFSRTILFVGASLEGIETYLEGINFRGYIPHQHYALAAVSGTAWEAKAEMLKRRYGIQVLPYTLSKDHPEVDEFLEKLAKESKKELDRKKVSSQFMRGKDRKTGRLKRVLLQNIGTFDELELDLEARWNILLGDNGVGKSTILKAIAVGICGDESQLFAHRLIKSGQNEAKIVLETDRKKYVTKLFRKNGGVKIKTIGRLLDSEGWLVMGFPPLRTVSWERSKGPQLEERKSRPTYDDILPLVTGYPDPRMDRLKQWIVNLDYYRVKSEKEDEKAGEEYGKLLHEFFLIVNQLTRGVSLQLKGVDLKTRQVMVVTDDGEVPIEAVSQGTTSLIGWIGILMQRLYEVYGHTADPREQFALVLIDEIDAHMHPQWQQSLVPDLEEIFPNIQFIATTHSPLIVGSMQPHEVFTLRRDPETPNRVTVEKVKQSFRGWRADQILTGPLFNLESSREPDTRKLLMRYTQLAARDTLSEDEQIELRDAAQKLKIRLPSTAERNEARKASEMIRLTWKKQLKRMSDEERKKVLDEINVQMQEVVTGSRRPA